MENKKYPGCNFGVSFDFNHKKIHTEGELELTYGDNLLNKQKTMTLVAILDGKIKDFRKANVNLKLIAKAPEMVNVNIKDKKIYV